MNIPQLETDRLILRALKESDLDSYADMMADDEVAGFIGGTLNRDDSWRYMATIIGHWQWRGFGFFALEEKSTGQFLGRVGPWQPEGWPGLEVGWTLARHAWGKGYATEAAAATINWIFAQRPTLTRIISVIDDKNLNSQAVARRLGEEKTEEIFYFKEYVLPVWAVSRAAWETRQEKA
ncbi:GNAT family N-acetyltransferase [Parvularcula sp. IMCC14364]|uniref:GNAT family N-acetyltransferase n=1 Tax=Parvularcula sp. IMCC14364 TaxID=3067902 RepID=UPI002741F2F6|nr:GNAT family N-acetyltransferase [Parvularcula sp. IMCC14364]